MFPVDSLFGSTSQLVGHLISPAWSRDGLVHSHASHSPFALAHLTLLDILTRSSEEQE